MGPYTVEQINEYLAQGSLLPTDYAWHEGLPDWVFLTEISGVTLSATPPPFNPTNSKDKEPCIHCEKEYDHENNEICPECKLPEFITYGKWECPRCGAVNKTYQGTELVAKSGPRMSYEVAEGVHHSVGSNTVGRESVTKCKECDTLLDYDRNYEKSSHEIILENYRKESLGKNIARIVLLLLPSIILFSQGLLLGISGLIAGAFLLWFGAFLRKDAKKFKIKKIINGLIVVPLCLAILFTPVVVFIIVPKMMATAADTLGDAYTLPKGQLYLVQFSDLIKYNLVTTLFLITYPLILFWEKEIRQRKMPFKSDD